MRLYEEEEHALINTFRSGFLLNGWKGRDQPGRRTLLLFECTHFFFF